MVVPASNDMLMQFQADILNVPVLRPKDAGVNCMGAAAMAGLKGVAYFQIWMKLPSHGSWNVLLNPK